jgi:hypothetical protein
MSEFNYESKWASLNASSNRENKGKAVLVDKTAACKVYLFTNYIDQRRSVIIKLPNSFTYKNDLPEVIGVTCKSRSTYGGLDGKLFVIEQKFSVHTSISEAFMSEIAKNVVKLKDEKQLMNCLTKEFEDWKNYFINITDELSREKQLGLYGEMFFLKNVLMKKIGIQRAMSSWKGYDGERHDFEIPSISFEVKATETKAPFRIKISNEKQLEIGKLKYLYLVVYNIVSSESNIGDLPLIVNSIINSLKQHPILLTEFKKNIMRVGYDFSSENKYNRSYTILNLKNENYNITDKFPTILTSDINKLKSTKAILDVKYSINMDACSKFIVKQIIFK